VQLRAYDQWAALRRNVKIAVKSRTYKHQQSPKYAASSMRYHHIIVIGLVIFICSSSCSSKNAVNKLSKLKIAAVNSRCSYEAGQKPALENAASFPRQLHGITRCT